MARGLSSLNLGSKAMYAEVKGLGGWRKRIGVEPISGFAAAQWF